MKDSFIDSLKDETPDVLKNIERILSDDSSSKIVRLLYEEQRGMPITKFVGVEKNGKMEAIPYNPTDIIPEKFTVAYIAKKTGMDEGRVKDRLKVLSQAALVRTYPAKNGDYHTITHTAAGYVKEVFCHIV